MVDVGRCGVLMRDTLFCFFPKSDPLREKEIVRCNVANVNRKKES